VNDPKNPEEGEVHINASDIKNVVDLPNDSLGDLAKVRDGYLAAIGCLAGLDDKLLMSLGLIPDKVKETMELANDREKALKFVGPFLKAAELMKETAADKGDQIAKYLTIAANTARKHGEQSPALRTIMGKLDPLFNYQFGPAAKAQATIAKNKAEEEAAAKAQAEAKAKAEEAAKAAMPEKPAVQ